MSPVRRSVQPSADHSDRNGADQLHPNRLTLLPRTKDFLDSIVYSPGHDLSHGTDAALSRVVGTADHAGVSSRSSYPLGRVWTSRRLRSRGN
jgi:hypothetical protein